MSFFGQGSTGLQLPPDVTTKQVLALNLVIRASLLRYIFPRSVRERYRERLIGFRLDILPRYKQSFQSRIYRFILERQRRRREQSRLVDYARRLLVGPPKPLVPKALRRRDAITAGSTEKRRGVMSYMSGYSSGGGVGRGGADGDREQGGRRKRLAAMAGRVYSAGATAMTEIRESYNQTRAGEMDMPESSKITIPGSFPDVAIVTKGNEQMVLFPSYAKRHIKDSGRQFEKPAGPPHPASINMNEEDYWRQEWARHEDEKAIVDVDVRGWIYNPHRGQMTRRNRVLIGLARQLSGIPAPRAQQQQSQDPSIASIHQQHEEEREQIRIAQKAKEIERKGKAEEEAAQKGGYSERPRDEDSEEEGNSLRQQRSGSASPSIKSTPGSPTLGVQRANTGGGAELSDAELAVANANLMARIGPFMTIPLVQMAITVFFYNDTESQSRTVMTNDSGHFILRAALDFVPTHVRVLANEDLSVTEPVQIIEAKGISLISDIDDTIKHSNISLGAREIFRNTFIRDLGDLTVEGVKEWYSTLHELGVRIHYCSNSPWQLFPVIASFFKLAGLPPGSIHLKQYSGMLQGIFEPVAERKKGTLEKIMADFPERRFLLVGDSGEADLEVYTDIAMANPGRIVAIFIRDVTTPHQAGYFDSGFGGGNGREQKRTPSRGKPTFSTDSDGDRPPLPPRGATEPPKADNSLMGDLIDLSDEPANLPLSESRHLAELHSSQHSFLPKKPTDLLAKKSPPPRPAKPVSLQSSPAAPILTPNETTGSVAQKQAPTPPQARKSTPSSGQGAKSPTLHPLAQMHNSSQQTFSSSQQTLARPRNDERHGSMNSTSSVSSKAQAPPPPPPPRRRGTPSSIKSISPRLVAAKRRSTANSDIDNMEALPSSAYGSPSEGPANKKLDLWRRRLERAQHTLEKEGVVLYTWRRGDDVITEAVGVVKQAMRDMGVKVGEGEKPDLKLKR